MDDLVTLLVGSTEFGEARASLSVYGSPLKTWGGTVFARSGETLDAWINASDAPNATARIRTAGGRTGIVRISGSHPYFGCVSVAVTGSGVEPF